MKLVKDLNNLFYKLLIVQYKILLHHLKEMNYHSIHNIYFFLNKLKELKKNYHELKFLHFQK